MSGCCLISSLGLLVLAFQLVRKVLPWLFENFIGPKIIGPKVDVKQMGKWALITGATEGIGKAYAKSLAKKGLNVVLVSRSLEKLQNVSKEITGATQVTVKLIDVDFTKGPEIYRKIQENIQGLDIGVLVNNVGMSYSHPEFLLDVENREVLFRNLITCNIISVTEMCQLVLPGMVERKKGVIINISSLAAVIPNPMLSVYSATKAFVDKFTEDLNTEYKSKGIVVQSVLPGFVATNMSKIRKPTMMAPSAEVYVNSALRTLGISTHTTGYFPHSLLKLFLDTLALFGSSSFANDFVLKQMIGIRKKALRNKDKSS